MQPVGHIRLAHGGNFRLDAAFSKQIQYRQRIVFRHFADDAHVIVQRSDVLRFVAVAARIVFVGAAGGGQNDDLRKQIPLTQRTEQRVRRTVKRLGRAVVRRAERGVAVTEVIGTAEHHDDIRVGVHLQSAGAEMGRIPGHGVLWGKTGGTDAVIFHHGARIPFDEIGETISNLLDEKTTVLAGPSGVGKSTLVNLLQAGVTMETGAVSEKIRRGKHTTRHSEFIRIKEDTYILDTPGFSSLELEEISAEELKLYFPEFHPHEGKCRFRGCVHQNEPDCAVKQAGKAGLVSKQRYLSYLQLYKELKEKEKYRY